MSEGFYLFKFNNNDAGQTILDEGPWFVHGHPLVLPRWTEDIVMYRQKFETIPVWVRFPNLNFCFRTSTALSKIASVIGKPISMDHATEASTRFAFARVCVEVGIDADFPTEIRMKYKGKSIMQKVEYAWKPNPCKTCHTFDHGEKACPLKGSVSKPKQIWVPKKPQVGNDVSTPTEGTMQANASEAEWTVIKNKNKKKQPASPVAKKSDCPKNNGPDPITSPGKGNRFSSLSNLDGDSTATVEELAATTALILDSSDADDDRPPAGMAHHKIQSSIHHLGKNSLPKLASSSGKPKPDSSGMVIKEKSNKN